MEKERSKQVYKIVVDALKRSQVCEESSKPADLVYHTDERKLTLNFSDQSTPVEIPPLLLQQQQQCEQKSWLDEILELTPRNEGQASVNLAQISVRSQRLFQNTVKMLSTLCIKHNEGKLKDLDCKTLFEIVNGLFSNSSCHVMVSFVEQHGPSITKGDDMEIRNKKNVYNYTTWVIVHVFPGSATPLQAC